jgi:hypothetical protein
MPAPITNTETLEDLPREPRRLLGTPALRRMVRPLAVFEQFP